MPREAPAAAPRPSGEALSPVERRARSLVRSAALAIHAAAGNERRSALARARIVAARLMRAGRPLESIWVRQSAAALEDATGSRAELMGALALVLRRTDLADVRRSIPSPFPWTVPFGLGRQLERAGWALRTREYAELASVAHAVERALEGAVAFHRVPPAELESLGERLFTLYAALDGRDGAAVRHAALRLDVALQRIHGLALAR